MKTIVDLQFNAFNIPGGADTILGPAQCADAVVKIVEYKILDKINVNLVFDDNDERIPRLLALLAPYGENGSVLRRDIYSEDDLQAARLLKLSRWIDATASAGSNYGTMYDQSQACPTCGTGVRQTSPLLIGDDEMSRVDKHRVADTYENDLLVRDTDVEKLIAAKVTGALFWPAYFKGKGGEVTELRWQQAVIENVMPPMAASSSLDRKGVCPTCHRGGYSIVSGQPERLFYRSEDLANAQDFNVTWEFFGDLRKAEDGGIRGIRWSDPLILVTPKVMNLLRAKTKKEQKYQGCDFIPIWIEDEKTP
jgi:hypothetical protein